MRKMKKYFFFAAAIVMMASCTNDTMVGDVTNPVSTRNDGAIEFGSVYKGMTRAGNYTGADAANELKNAFVVGGFKGATSVATTVVFDNYNVEYAGNTANTTESNTANWEYVGLDVNPLAGIYVDGVSDKQTIKYWDYSQAQYDFIAYSLGDGGATATTITPATAGDDGTAGAYTLTGTTAQLGTVHVADLVTVLKADYNKVVNITFRKLLSKVRVALYETVPGYSVTDVKFYTSDAAISGGSTSGTAALYASSSVLPIKGTYTVYYPTINDETPTSDKNKAHLKFTAAATAGTQSYQTFDALATDKLVKSEKYEYKMDETTYDEDTKFLLGRTSSTATYAGAASPYYQDVLPNENGTSLTLKVDYTLVSTDGSGETIKVVGAKAVVPAIYAQWTSGYAYTYIFKISDNTNGYTSQVEGSEIDGLHPITFDAVVVETTDNIQESVTTVATPSITTYQHDPAVNVTENNEYIAGTIYAMVMNGGSLIGDLNGTTSPAKDAAKLFELNRVATEAEVMDALLMQASTTTASKIIGRNGLELTPKTSEIDNEIEAIPGADGNNISVTKGEASALTVAAGKTYAYVYTVTQPGSGTAKYEAVPASAIEVGTTDVSNYFTYDGTDYTAASGTATADAKYYAKYTVYTATYAVKVIKVKA